MKRDDHLPRWIRTRVPLAPKTTLGLGGAAELFVEVGSESEVLRALRWARGEGRPVTWIGGGSNVVVPDAGLEGLVLQLRWKGRRVDGVGDEVRLRLAAGEDWDEVVAWSVDQGWSGLECLSGIPGSVGATPVQNVGAYGVEISELVDEVRVLDTRSGEVGSWSRQACAFSYRDSVFKRHPGRWIVLEVSLRLQAGGCSPLRYRELKESVAEGGGAVDAARVRREVLGLRRQKSMVLDDPEDPNRHSAGSFFLNPILTRQQAGEVIRRAARDGRGEPPTFPVEGGVKVPAAWLIEAAGFPRGFRRGRVGISTRHALALVHLGGGTAEELLELAAEVRDGVASTFGVVLHPEPTLLGGLSLPSLNP